MEPGGAGLVFVALFIGALGLGALAPLLDRQARLRRRALASPLRRICDLERDEVARIRGIVRSIDPLVTIPYAARPGVFHATVLTDAASPTQTTTFQTTARCDLLIDDGTGQARVSRQTAIEIVGRAPATGHARRGDAEVAAFLDGDLDALFAKSAAVLWEQQALFVGDEVVVWARCTHEPIASTTRPSGYRETPLRVVLVPVAAGLPIVVVPV